MVASNLSPYVLADGGPDWFRFYGTFAAPLFICLAGMMVSLAGCSRQRTFWYYLVRGAAIMTVGAGIDMYVWGFVPFLTMDVLYLIGLAMPFCYLLSKLNPALRYMLTIGVFAAVPFIQEWMPYRRDPDNIIIASGLSLAEIIAQTQPVQSWLADGWFPVFPWLGVAFAGYLTGEARQHYSSFATGKVLLAGLASLAAGAVWWVKQPIERIARGGYPDLFYPPTLQFLLIAAGVILLLFWLLDRRLINPLYSAFKLYGRCSLLMYVLHSAIIGAYFWPQSQAGIKYSFPAFCLIYLAFMTGLLLVAWAVNKAKPRELNPAVRFFIGS